MREIGGYIELDTCHRPMLHEGAVALNCGRNALAYVLRARQIKKLWIPKFICDSVTGVCTREGAAWSFYSVGRDFLPTQEIEAGEDEWVYFVNYYSQFDNSRIAAFVEKYRRVIVDQAQSYFQPPLPGVDTLYTCRKYFGVPDGAFLYTDAVLGEEPERDESFDRMRHLLGRYERTAPEFYGAFAANEALFAAAPIRRMSRLTMNLLRGIDYERVKRTREENYRFLHRSLGGRNGLQPGEQPGTFMYPLLLENGAAIRKKLQEERIYIPTLWPDVLGWCGEEETEYQLAQNILPLPIDQRYGVEDMRYLVGRIEAAAGAAS